MLHVLTTLYNSGVDTYSLFAFLIVSWILCIEILPQRARECVRSRLQGFGGRHNDHDTGGLFAQATESRMSKGEGLSS
jgi:hypothetical protein